MKAVNKNLSRRNFIRVTGMTGAALTIGYYLPSFGKGSEEIITGETASELGIELNAFISIDTTGKVSILNHRSEMGQGSFQAVPQMIAEELEVNLDQVNILFATGNGKKYGNQSTVGSSTVRGSYERLMRMGASAREMLIGAASKKWNVTREECYAENGEVIHRPSGKKLGYGDLVEEASKLTPPKEIKLKDKGDYKIIGKPLKRQDIPGKINGKAEFGLDKKLPGMMYAVVEHNPRFHGKVKSFDDTAAKTVAGVKKIFKIQIPVFARVREGVAVVADNFWAAMQARKMLKVEWDDDGFEHVSTEQLFARMKEDLKKPGLSDRTGGNFEVNFENAEKKLQGLYEAPYQSHSCMEPVNCTAFVQENKCEIWAPMQTPDRIQQYLSTNLGIPIENVTVNMTFLGGGFGRKSFNDYPYEAAIISKEIKAPVQLLWMREDDMTQGPFRPGAVYECKAGLKNGRIVAFQGKMASQNMGHQRTGADKTSHNANTSEGFLKPYFESIPNTRFADIPTESLIPVTYWRSVYASTNCFAYESFLDELALAAGKDPLDFRRDHLPNERYQKLIDKIEATTGWKTRGKNAGWGVAITECFSSIVGEVVKISRNAERKIKIDKVIAVMDCGWYVNPDTIRAQVEGSIVMAFGAAVKHETHFQDGRAVEKNFDSYKMARISDIPEIEVHVMDNAEKPGGAGEPGLPPFAPSLCNAIFDLTGKRIRKLPFNMEAI